MNDRTMSDRLANVAADMGHPRTRLAAVCRDLACASRPNSRLNSRPRARAGVATQTRAAPAWQQFAGTLGGGGAGGEHIVHQQNLASLDALAGDDLEGSADLLAALVQRECHLRFGKAHAQQGGHVQGDAAAGGVLDAALGGAGDQLGLVESAGAHAQLVHRDGNHQQLFHVDIALQLEAGGSGEARQRMGRRADAIVFEEVNQLAQNAGVGSVVDRPLEGRRIRRRNRCSAHRQRRRRQAAAGLRRRCSGRTGWAGWIQRRRGKPEDVRG